MEENLLMFGRLCMGVIIFTCGYFMGQLRGLKWASDTYRKTTQLYEQHIEFLKRAKK